MNRELLRPAALAAEPRRPGRVHVVAPSGPVDQQQLARGLAHVRRRWGEPSLADNVALRDGYFAGDDEARLAGLGAAMRSPAELIWGARGGYGASRLLSRLDPTALRERPRVLLGFSDITALLCWAYVRAGVCSIHGPSLSQLDDLGEDDRQRLWTLLEGELPSPLVAEGDDATCVNGGRVEGRLIVGNLQVLTGLVGTPDFPDLDGAILAIEEIGVRPYQIDRAVTQLVASGCLRGIEGVAVGQLYACNEPKGTRSLGASAHEVMLAFVERLGVPGVFGLPFGHAPDQNAALPFGSMARLDAAQGTLELLEPVCR